MRTKTIIGLMAVGLATVAMGQTILPKSTITDPRIVDGQVKSGTFTIKSGATLSAEAGATVDLGGAGLTMDNGLWLAASFQYVEEKMLLLTSVDTKTWIQLSDVPVSSPFGTIRDPSIVHRGGRFLVAYTATGFSGTGGYFGIAESTDLKTWTFYQINVASFVGSNVWDPEWFVDPVTDQLHIFVSVGTGGYMDVYEIHPVSESAIGGSWSTPVTVTGSALSADCVNAPYVVYKDGEYHMFYDLLFASGSQQVKSSSLTSGYNTLVNATMPSGLGEGPCVIQLPNGNYRIYGENAQRRIAYADSADLATWGSVTAVDQQCSISHPSVIPADTFDATMAVFGAQRGLLDIVSQRVNGAPAVGVGHFKTNEKPQSYGLTISNTGEAGNDFARLHFLTSNADGAATFFDPLDHNNHLYIGRKSGATTLKFFGASDNLGLNGLLYFGLTTSVPSFWKVAGTPEGAVSAAVGSIRVRSDGGAGTTLYTKESGTGNTGWAGVLTSSSMGTIAAQLAVAPLTPKQTTGNGYGRWTGAPLILGCFKSSGAVLDNRLFLYQSEDGENWEALNGGNPVLSFPSSDVSTCSVAKYNGKWYVAYTTGTYGDSMDVGISESLDLINWTNHQLIDTNVTAGQIYTWAPHLFVDDDGAMHCYFTTVTNTNIQAIWHMKASDKTLATWSAPTELSVTSDSNPKRDPFVMKVGSVYYMWYIRNGGSPAWATSAAADSGFALAGTGGEGEATWLVPLPGGGWRRYFEVADTGPGLRYTDLGSDFSGLEAYADATPITPANLHHGFILVSSTPDSQQSPRGVLGAVAYINSVTDSYVTNVGWGKLSSVPSALSSIGGLTPAANTMPYYTGSTTAATTGLSAFARTLLDDADSGAMRATLDMRLLSTPQYTFRKAPSGASDCASEFAFEHSGDCFVNLLGGTNNNLGFRFGSSAGFAVGGYIAANTGSPRLEFGVGVTEQMRLTSTGLDVAGIVVSGSGNTTITTAAGLLVGGVVDIAGTTEDTAPASDDYILTRDTSASANKKVSLANLRAFRAGTVVDVTADDQVIATTGRNFIRITSDSATSTDRTFTLSNGTDGQLLILKFVDASDAAELVDGGNAQLSSTWTPTNQDTLSLIWDAVDELWTETGRSAN